MRHERFRCWLLSGVIGAGGCIARGTANVTAFIDDGYVLQLLQVL